MPLRFLMDEHVPRAITNALKLRGIDVVTAQDDGSGGLPDPMLLQRAAETGRVLFTRDRDFLAIGHEWQSSNRFFAGIVYIHERNTHVGGCIERLFRMSQWPPEAMANRVEFLPAGRFTEE